MSTRTDLFAFVASKVQVCLRADVCQFALLMDAAMDSKQVERETRSDPHYLTAEYPLNLAIACMQDKAAQLEHWAVRADAHSTESDAESMRAHDRAIRTAAHLANFCMIIAAKLNAKHVVTNTSGEGGAS